MKRQLEPSYENHSIFVCTNVRTHERNRIHYILCLEYLDSAFVLVILYSAKYGEINVYFYVHKNIYSLEHGIKSFHNMFILLNITIIYKDGTPTYN